MLGHWQFYGTQVDGSGFVKELPSAQVTVRRESDGSLASLDSDIDGSSPGLDNPFTSAADGEISFYADATERYRIDIVLGALTVTLRHQSVSTNARALRGGGSPLNFGVAHAVASNALTLSLKNDQGNDPSNAAPVSIRFPSSTASSGIPAWREVAAALSVTVPSTATLGHNSGLKQYIYLYAIDNDGAVELAVSFKYFGASGIASTTALSTGSDTGTTMYSTTARTSKAFVCLGYCEITESTAGTWASTPSAWHLAPFTLPVISFSARKDGSTNQTGVVTATQTKVTFTNEEYDNGGLFDSTTNSRFTPPPGSVRLKSSFLFTASVDTSQSYAMVYKNGSEYRRGPILLSPGTANIGAIVEIEDECNGTDYYEIWCFQTTGANQSISANTAITYFIGSWHPGRS